MLIPSRIAHYRTHRANLESYDCVVPLGNGWAEGVHPDDFERCLKIYVGSFDARRHFSMIYRLRRADGVYRDILDNGAPFYRGGVFAGYFGSCIDVSDQQATEAQLRQMQKIEALGKLTGGVAHD